MQHFAQAKSRGSEPADQAAIGFPRLGYFGVIDERMNLQLIDDVAAEHIRFEREKLSPGPLRDFKHDGRTLARFFFATDPDGYKIEFIERK